MGCVCVGGGGSDVNQISFPSRFQPDTQRPHGLPAAPGAGAGAERQPGEDLDSGGEVPRNLDRSRCHLSNVTACKGPNQEKNKKICQHVKGEGKSYLLLYSTEGIFDPLISYRVVVNSCIFMQYENILITGDFFLAD